MLGNRFGSRKYVVEPSVDRPSDVFSEDPRNGSLESRGTITVPLL
jgi:hypothetical protein